MARPLKLKPKKVSYSPASPWMLFIPSYLSKTGKNQRLFFLTEGAALRAAQRIKNRHHMFGTSMRFLTPGRMSEANEAYRRLDDFEVSLIEVVNDWITRHKAAGNIV